LGRCWERNRGKQKEQVLHVGSLRPECEAKETRGGKKRGKGDVEQKEVKAKRSKCPYADGKNAKRNRKGGNVVGRGKESQKRKNAWQNTKPGSQMCERRRQHLRRRKHWEKPGKNDFIKGKSGAGQKKNQRRGDGTRLLTDEGKDVGKKKKRRTGQEGKKKNDGTERKTFAEKAKGSEA